ncbi:hypothetical protein EV207_12430 [Scopulibacillus darangshiensis]|uniref:Uncharacterized protein n=1 Tax=Scopulibacillus darangshiensis TaxID=442528 RepID=A0A4R2NSK5_9BACL|nr:hypothetical protein [Scopulibacillus darangshiensis]TCP24531.1 hypothetical protein EV207_12430 [Scopulibacillus darangshiensis]
MTKSRARKIREKRIQEGRRNPSADRGIYALADLRTRKTKTKMEKLYQHKHKGRLSNHEDNWPIHLFNPAGEYFEGNETRVISARAPL